MAQWPVTVKNDDGGGKIGAFGHQGLTGGGGETQSARRGVRCSVVDWRCCSVVDWRCSLCVKKKGDVRMR